MTQRIRSLSGLGIVVATSLCLAASHIHAESWDDTGKVIMPTSRRMFQTNEYAPASSAYQAAYPQGARAPVVRTKTRAGAQLADGKTHSTRTTPQLLDQIARGAELHAIDPHLVKAVIQAESNFNAAAVSPKNAIGLMQVMPGTAKDLGLRAVDHVGVEQLLTDPWISILVGSRYLAAMLQEFSGRVDLAIAAYNAGPGAVRKAGNRIPNYPETQAYVRTVLGYYQANKRAAALRGAGV